MELYLFSALIFLYILSLFIFKKGKPQKLWLSIFLLSFLVTSLSVGSIRIGKEELMVNITNIWWLYFTYIFAIIMSVLGFLNLWIFRKIIWAILTGKKITIEKE